MDEGVDQNGDDSSSDATSPAMDLPMGLLAQLHQEAVRGMDLVHLLGAETCILQKQLSGLLDEVPRDPGHRADWPECALLKLKTDLA